MTRARDNRIDKLRRTITVAPVRAYVLQEEYELFKMFGELPEEGKVADAVLRRSRPMVIDAAMRPLAVRALQGNLPALHLLLDRTLGRIAEAPTGEPLDMRHRS